MDLPAALKAQIKLAHMITEQVIDGVTAAQADWQPDGRANSIAATYAHIVIGEDSWFQGIMQGKAPLSATTWAGRVGASQLPAPNADWSEWSRTAKIDLPAMREYAKAVYAATEAYLDTLKSEDCDRIIKLPFDGFGDNTDLAFVIGMMIQHTANHAGEMSALKGMQGLVGYGF